MIMYPAISMHMPRPPPRIGSSIQSLDEYLAPMMSQMYATPAHVKTIRTETPIVIQDGRGKSLKNLQTDFKELRAYCLPITVKANTIAEIVAVASYIFTAESLMSSLLRRNNERQ